MVKNAMDRLSTAAFMSCQRVARIPKCYLLLIILLLGAFTSLIATNYESHNQRVVNTTFNGGASPRMARNAVPEARMMMAQSMEASMDQPALMASSLSADASMTSMQHDASSSYGSSNSALNLGTLVLDSMKILSRNDHESGDDRHNETQTRMLIHEGNVEVKVYIEDMEPMTDKIITMAKEKARGYVESKNLIQETRWEYNVATRNHENIEYWFIHLDLRIANAMFHLILNEITSLVKRYDGSIIQLYTNTKDATDEYVDVSARAETLEKTRQAMEVLLTKSSSIQDILQVQRELTSLTQQVESYRKRAIYIQKASDMSRLSVHIREQKRTSFSETKSWDPYRTLLTAFYHMKIVAQFSGDALIYSIMWSIPLSLLMLISLFLSRPQSSTRRD